MTALVSDVRDAGPLSIEEAVIAFDAEMDEELGAQACYIIGDYVSVYPTYVQICGTNS